MPVLTWRALTTDLQASPMRTSARPIKILQIGDGNFLRGFVDWMVDVANEKGVFGGGVAIAAAPAAGASRRRSTSRTGSIRCCCAARAGGARRCRPARRHRRADGARPLRAMGRDRELAASRALASWFPTRPRPASPTFEEPLDPERCPTSFPAKVAALLKAR